MPRQRIALAQAYVEQSDDGTQGSISYPFEIQVGWGVDTVQVATRNNDAGDQFGPESGWYVDLNRTEINQLVRLLRKARDAAFGRDE